MKTLTKILSYIITAGTFLTQSFAVTASACDCSCGCADCECCQEQYTDAPLNMPGEAVFEEQTFAEAPEDMPVTVISFEPDYSGGYEDFLDKLGFLESSNHYDRYTGTDYVGRYQTGTICLIDTGFKDRDGEWTELANDWGVYSLEDYLSTPEAQDFVIEQSLKNNWKYLKKNGSASHINEIWEGIRVTKSGLLGAAHLVGAGGVSTLFDGENPADTNGTTAYYYMDVLGNYYLDSVIS